MTPKETWTQTEDVLTWVTAGCVYQLIMYCTASTLSLSCTHSSSEYQCLSKKELKSEKLNIGCLRVFVEHVEALVSYQLSSD